MPSLQLARYLQHRADGDTIERASELSGIGLGEAALHEKDIERGVLVLPEPRARARTRETQSTKEDNMAREDVKTSMRMGGGPEVSIDLEKGIDHPDNAAAKEQVREFVEAVLPKPATDTGQRLRLYIERVERLDGEIKDLNSDKSDLFKGIKFDGFDTKTIKRIIKLRKMDSHTRQEAEALLSTYMNAIGMTPIEEAIALAAAA